jgi:hypothetical protein
VIFFVDYVTFGVENLTEQKKKKERVILKKKNNKLIIFPSTREFIELAPIFINADVVHFFS